MLRPSFFSLKQKKINLTSDKDKNFRFPLSVFANQMYAVYKKQDEAFANANGGIVWARDDVILEKTVTKKYICSSYEEFWRRYSQMSDDERHHYELIRGPCHPYFDVEYKYKKEDDMKEKFGDVSCALFDFINEVKKMCIECEFANKIDLLMLDSSNEI